MIIQDVIRDAPRFAAELWELKRRISQTSKGPADGTLTLTQDQCETLLFAVESLAIRRRLEKTQ